MSVSGCGTGIPGFARRSPTRAAGYPTSSASALHRDIEGMRERAELLGGHVDIRSGPGIGTTVSLEATLGNGTSGRS